MRVYVPATRDLIASWRAAGVVAADGPERSVAAEADEESEYAALMAAADDSRALGADRRFVVVAELSGADPDASFGLDRVVAVHADDVPGTAADVDLSWYAPEELDVLLG